MGDRTPVLIGVGQTVYRGEPRRAAELSPAGFAAEAAARALADAGLGGRGDLVDRIAAIRMTADNVPPGAHPFGTPTNFPRAVARRIGADPAVAIYGPIGGQSPQSFVSECAQALHESACEMALIVAAEATGLERAARRAGLELDWSEQIDGTLDDRGPGTLNIHPVEVRHGLYVPVTVYSLIEHAQRAAAGRGREAHARAIAELFAGFSEVAAGNPYAQFPIARTSDFLAIESAENYRVSDPYLKWLVAQDAVNQGAAVLMTTEAKADELGVPRSKRIYLHGYAEAADLALIERPDLGASRAAEIAGAAAFAMAGIGPERIGPKDIYSCFPCAVTAACAALGISTDNPNRLTVTGGLPFFGGPGNGYSLYAIAALGERLRDLPGELGLISANGGYMSKEAIGIYGAARPSEWRPSQAAGLDEQVAQRRVSVDPNPSGQGRIESFSIGYAKGAPARGWIIGRTEAGHRFAAAVQAGDAALEEMVRHDPIGRTVEIDAGERTNGFAFAA